MRERLVTRTITATVYTCMVVDEISKKVENIEISIPSAESMNAKAIDNAIRTALPDGKLFVQTINSKQVETLYGMPEQEFIRLAKVLPPRTKTE